MFDYIFPFLRNILLVVYGIWQYFFRFDPWELIFAKLFFSAAYFVFFAYHFTLLAKTLLVRKSKNEVKSSFRKPDLKRAGSRKLRFYFNAIPLLVLILTRLNIAAKLRRVFTKDQPKLPFSGELRWHHRLHNGAFLLKNGTLVFENNTRIYYNGTIRYPNGTLVHSNVLDYFDYAACSSYILEEKLPYCGLESVHKFQAWSAGHKDSGIPLFFPRNLEEVAWIVREIGDRGCVVRPVGSGQSMDTVLDEESKFTIAVSLANYVSDDPKWRLSSMNESRSSLETEGKIRAEGGKTLLDVYSVIRPLGYFLPTHPPSWSITVGSIVNNPVSGGTYGASFLNTYMTRIQAMLYNGTIVELFQESDLAFWRNSMGLLGIVLAAEFKVVKRENFHMGFRTYMFSHWNKWVLDEILSHLLPGSFGAHFLLDPSVDKVLGIGYVNAIPKVEEKACYWSLLRLSCSAYFPFTSINSDLAIFCQDIHVASSPNIEKRIHRKLPQFTINRYQKIFGTNYVEMDFKLPHFWYEKPPLSVFWQRDLLEATMNNVIYASNRWNDGFWEVGNRPYAWISYIFDLDYLFASVDVYRQYFHELESHNARLLQVLLKYPLEIHFVSVDTGNILIPVDVPGHYVSLTARSSSIGDYDEVFTELEKRWQKIPSAFPNPAGYLTFLIDSNSSHSNQLNFTYLSREKQLGFLHYKSHFDPYGIFWGGSATMLFNHTRKEMTYKEPTSDYLPEPTEQFSEPEM